MTSFTKTRLMILLVHVVSGSTIDDFKSAPLRRELIHNDDHYCEDESGYSTHHRKLPCLCPNKKELKSLCPKIENRKEVKLVKGENMYFECRASKHLGHVTHYRIRMWWCNGTMGEICYKSQQAPTRTPRTYFAYSESGYNDDEWMVGFNITNATSSDENTYTCVANTEDEDYTRIPGYKSIHVSVNEAVGPKLTKQPPPSIYKNEGRFVELYCGSEGYPDPVIRWLKNGTPLEKNASNVIQLERHSVLKIQNISKDDEGMYQCIAYNKIGFIESEGTHVHVDGICWKWPVCLVIVGFLLGVMVSVLCCFRYNEGKETFGSVDKNVCLEGFVRNRSNAYSPIPIDGVC